VKTVLMAAAVGVMLAAEVMLGQVPATKTIDVQVFKRPGCGCCEKWADHVRAAGFRVTVAEAADFDAMKRRNAIPPNLVSCHTSVAGVYRIEGHVPIESVARLLTDKPPILGIAVPGMPAGSPGMESAVKDSYEVIAFEAAGRQTVYAMIKGTR
jgi:hypothetical protein